MRGSRGTYGKIRGVIYNGHVDSLFSKEPSKHTTSFRLLYNVHNVKTTSYGRQPLYCRFAI